MDSTDIFALEYLTLIAVKGRIVKKLFLLIAIRTYIGLQGMAQAGSFTLKYNTVDEPVATIGIPYSKDVTENALKEYLDKRDFTGPAPKGLLFTKGLRQGNMGLISRTYTVKWRSGGLKVMK